jgi:hypothetical protein
MPRGHEPEGEAPLSNAERQARYRARRKEKHASVTVRPRPPAGRWSRIQRWHAAVAELVDLQPRDSTLCHCRFGTRRPRRYSRRSPTWTSKDWPRLMPQWPGRMDARLTQCAEVRARASRAALRAPASRLRPLTRSPSPQHLVDMPFRTGVSTAGGVISTLRAECHF